MNRISHGHGALIRIGLPSFLFTLVLLFLGIPAQAQDEKPEIINNVPKNIPLKVEIIEPAKTEDYPEGIQIKVTNTGDKPIYSIRMFLDIDDSEKKVIGPNGKVAWMGFPLDYGRKELNSAFKELPTEGDVPIKPNEIYIFKVSAYRAKNFRTYFLKHEFSPVRLYRLRFQDLTFGDATGFIGNGKFF